MGIKRIPICLGALLFASYASFLHANPESPTVVSGDVNFDTVGNVLTVESSSDRAIVNWESFSISGNQATVFTLPYSSSAILNRVTGNDPSNILGMISSNGQVFLINSNGILFGSDSVVNTHTFLSSTLDCLDEDFLNVTDMTFAGDDNSDVFLTNLGTIEALGGDIILISYQVENSGSLVAEDGGVALGSGVEIVYQPFSDDRIAIVNHSSSSPVSLGVNDGGIIIAPSVELKADGNFYELAISHAGVIDAIGSSGAFVRFVASEGSTLANGTINANFQGLGGRIDITGSDVEVSSSAILDVSAPFGQGVINIGGGFDGTDPDILNATTTFIDGAFIDASADTLGSGGTVVVWADDTNTFSGTIVAAGGSVGGDGGFVQIGASEAGCYNNFGTIDVSALNGDPGVVDLHGTCCSCE